jgi:hypothetical protein
MRQIVYALTGSEINPPILDRLVERFVERVRDDIEDIIWNASFLNMPEGHQLYEAFSALDSSRQASFCLDPLVFRSMCAAQLGMSNKTLGQLTKLAAEISTPKDALQGFSLGETIWVDIGSDYCATLDPTSPVFMLPLDPLSHDERNIVTCKLTAAIAEIDATAPSFGRLIRNYTRRIFVRKIEGQVSASEQVDSDLGAIRLRNVHTELYTHDQLVDDLIHESTHGFLGTFEHLYFPFNPYGFRGEDSVRPVSPWSFRSIQALPFIHACFVYFAMYHYCELRLRSGLADKEEVKRLYRRQNKYASGFLMPGRLSEYVSTLAPSDPRVLLAIDWLEQIMNSYFAMNVSEDAGEQRKDQPYKLVA